MSSAVPWSGDVRGNGSPSVTFTALPNDATLMAVMPDVVIRRDHGVELAAHRAHEHGVGGERPGEPAGARGGREHAVVLVAEPAVVAGVRVERAQREARLGDAEPVAQPARVMPAACAMAPAVTARRHVAQRDVRGGEHHAQAVGGEHHRAPRPVSAASISVWPGTVVAARAASACLSMGAVTMPCQRRRASASATARSMASPASRPAAAAVPPRLQIPAETRRRDPDAVGPHHHPVRGVAHAGVLERASDDLRADAARIAERDGETRALHSRMET